MTTLDFDLIINCGKENEEKIEVSEPLKDTDNATNIYQIKEFLREYLDVNFYDLNLTLFRNKRKINIHDDIDIQDGDKICVVINNSVRLI